MSGGRIRLNVCCSHNHRVVVRVKSIFPGDEIRNYWRERWVRIGVRVSIIHGGGYGACMRVGEDWGQR